MKKYISLLFVFYISGCVPTGQTLPNSNNPAEVPSQETESVASVENIATSRVTTMDVGLLPRHVQSFQGEGFALDLFRYVCQWSAVFRNTGSQTVSPVVMIYGVDAAGNNVGYYTPGFYFSRTPPGTESRAFGTVDLCHNGPIRIEGRYR